MKLFVNKFRECELLSTDIDNLLIALENFKIKNEWMNDNTHLIIKDIETIIATWFAPQVEEKTESMSLEDQLSFYTDELSILGDRN